MCLPFLSMSFRYILVFNTQTTILKLKICNLQMLPMMILSLRGFKDFCLWCCSKLEICFELYMQTSKSLATYIDIDKPWTFRNNLDCPCKIKSVIHLNVSQILFLLMFDSKYLMQTATKKLYSLITNDGKHSWKLKQETWKLPLTLLTHS